jgi:hypothetical protein
MIQESNYRKVKTPINSTLYAVQDNEYKWGVIDGDENVIVQFGKYAWIDGFQNGIAKVIAFSDTTSPNIVAMFDDDLNVVTDIDSRRVAAQGIINEKGDEVLPLEYKIWKFYGKDFPTIKVFKGEECRNYTYSELNPEYHTPKSTYEPDDDYDDYDDYGTHYGEYAGSYAQDVMGYSDDVINDAFDGDPDAYWNID